MLASSVVKSAWDAELPVPDALQWACPGYSSCGSGFTWLRWRVGAAAESGKAQVSETIRESAQDLRIAHHLDRLFLLLTRYPPRQ
jgi:hypothetical protein